MEGRLGTQWRIEIKQGPNWDDDLAGGDSARSDVNLKKFGQEIAFDFRDIFMKYLPRNCNHCLNPACVAACPSSAIYKREEDGVVLVSQDNCRGWRHCVPACPYKKVYYNWKTNKAEKYLEFDAYEYEKIYKLLAIAKYSERIKLPAGLQGKTHEELRELQGSAG